MYTVEFGALTVINAVGCVKLVNTTDGSTFSTKLLSVGGLAILVNTVTVDPASGGVTIVRLY